MIETEPEQDQIVDVDISGHLATALFIGVIVFMLFVIYALATAA